MVGGGVAASKENIEAAVRFAESVQCPVVTTYLHGDAFPQDHPLCAGILSYGGSLGAMKVAKDADVVLALGTRINPYMKNPQYGLDWWPKNAKLVQVDIDSRRLGLTSPVAVAVNGDVGQFMDILTRYFTSPEGKHAARQLLDPNAINGRLSKARAHVSEWEATLKSMTDDTKLCQPNRVRPRQALAAVETALPENTMLSVDTGNLSALSSSYMPKFITREPSLVGPGMWASCGPAFGAMMGAKLARPDRPAVA
ncbi:Sulfoacetaldehyde acetyltransferase, putative [Perkinsus marinus ATCC 50983]|uniref:Sulfoacetaldehyde acetyltransferase, putative n=1 Tax=Perkinsus marinus (strain ATCC 50983 / TXsc) TaxID=423536 RepID=C5L7M0_PERM5|nr:Sulfoacetaldehyde acetyltransferase, putative [Perkinsus marinus ATCC 50983]EER07482.1 Sulfoacetaldehyde acetyltransferase, putative [Perkinsus marinus ATCC 50983]|eukprot:XP_002775666.1 Sulfoacetaldehyde acetyltransferase, putative [Perkinsus marinus ATCC 50983]